MSKKLLMNKTGDDYKGPMIYETVAITNAQAVPSDSNYSLLEGEPVYFNGCYGSTVFNGYDEPFVLGDLNPDGTYTYNIKQTSVANPEISSMTTFVLEHQLSYYNSTYRDHLYWSDEDGRYMIVKNVEDATYVGTTPDAQFEDYTSQLYSGGTLVGLPSKGYPNGDGTHQAIYRDPTARSNWRVTNGNSAMNQRIYAVVGDEYATTDKLVVCLYNYTANEKPSIERLKALFANYPLYATFPSYHRYGSVTEAPTYATNIAKKIKLKSYKGGTKYSMVDTGGNVREIYVDIPIMETKYVPCTKTFEGTDVTLDIGDNYMVDPDGKIYLEWFQAESQSADIDWDLLGAVTPDYQYEYQVVVKSADGKQQTIVPFILDYQVMKYRIGTRTTPTVQWDESKKCYTYTTTHNYVYIDTLDHPLLGSALEYTTKTNKNYDAIAYKFDNVPYMDNSSTGDETAGADVEGYVNQKYTNNCGHYYLGYYAGYNQVFYHKSYPLGFSVAVRSTKTGENGVWLDRNAAEAQLKQYPIELVYSYAGYETNPITVDTILKKKVELPNFGPGTTYSLQRTGASGNTVKAPIRITVPVKYNFRLEYKIIDGRDILVKSTKRMVVRPDKPAYIMQVRGDSNLSYDTSSNTETIQLLGNRMPDGSYEYYIRQNFNGKETIVNKFQLPYMLTFCTINGAGTRPESSFESPPQQSILYWDPVSKSYKVEMRSMYYYADTAYGDIDFAAYRDSSYSIGEGAWEFLVDGKPTYNFSAGQSPDAWSNYIRRSFEYAYNTDHEIGTVFPILRKSSFPSTHDNVMGIYTTAADFEALDAYLKNNPFHLIMMPYWRYTNGWKDVPRRDTGITKPVPIKITDVVASKGATYSISNDGLSARFKMAVPVTYLDVDLPTPDYTLPEPLECNGSNKYINTGLKLFDTAKDFTILLDYQHYCAGGTYVANDRVILHCRYESTNTSYRRCGLAVETGTAPQAHVRGATDYLTNGDILGTDKYLLEKQSREMDTALSLSNTRYRIVIVYKAGLPHRVIQVDENNILYDYPLYKDIPAFRSHARPLYLGCQNSTSNARSKYFAGRINECKVWNGVALDDDQILRAIGDGPYPEPNYKISNCVCSSNNRVNTGMKLFDIYKDSTIAIKFTSKSTTIGAFGEVLSVGCGDNNSFALRIYYTKSTKTYTIEHSGGGLTDYRNILADNATLPVGADGNICIFIVYRMGRPISIVDYSTGEAVYLPLNDVKNFTNAFATSQYAVTLGYRQQTATDSAASRTSSVWDGTIHNCMIWNGRMLNESQIDNVYKRLLK